MSTVRTLLERLAERGERVVLALPNGKLQHALLRELYFDGTLRAGGGKFASTPERHGELRASPQPLCYAVCERMAPWRC